LAWASAELGEEDQARALLLDAADRVTAQRHQLALLDTLRVCALLDVRQARWHEAERALEEALALARAMPYPYAEAKALLVYGQLHAAKGEPEPARARFAAALAILDRLGEGLYRPHIARALAELQ